MLVDTNPKLLPTGHSRCREGTLVGISRYAVRSSPKSCTHKRYNSTVGALVLYTPCAKGSDNACNIRNYTKPASLVFYGTILSGYTALPPSHKVPQHRLSLHAKRGTSRRQKAGNRQHRALFLEAILWLDAVLCRWRVLFGF